MKTLKELWDKAIDLEFRLCSLKDLVQNEGSTRADLEVFNDEVNTFISSFHCWQQECNKIVSQKLVATSKSILQDQIKYGLFNYGVKELTGLELYTVEGATEEFVILHSIRRGLQFDGNNEISFTGASLSAIITISPTAFFAIAAPLINASILFSGQSPPEPLLATMAMKFKS